MADLSLLEDVLGHQFADKQLLKLALTHRSAGANNNERLEFLGDSVVNHLVAEALFLRFPKAREGIMSRMRASLVCGETLADIARQLAVGDYLTLGSGERKSGGHQRESILADTLEALVGAVLLDSNLDTCRACLLNWFDDRLQHLSLETEGKDAKTRLQEYLQSCGQKLPQYQLLSTSGSDHARDFTVTCTVTGLPEPVTGIGSSRRKAEQCAANNALAALNTNG